ncbi:MAG TPA: pyruvate:ferredoxin (flavodoxin) oxidoreductase [Synergistaceae bacterium]|jgi:pyruvate-ferredoxin/flavodoxin oxidoreductase|nr:pyruvate:ferredoxin (flavodoxin) oxidoreductase [Synergistaceae bacterium]NLL40765.1 pyruvate:ferredoxin (flavodoxin) oxidoreductase [Synergistaceae bacterium]HPX03223.1 pyruvate:ferredoxin (flavodoxin) oxidoreductase [Synergistaceae bacterium]HQA54091.1 pyruvate:ferredoxin (flavodoxin) oxidoreductase [Synergistaceae bacterium]
MTERKMVTLDGNEAAAYVAHAVNEVIAIYPITPSSPMGEWADQWTSERRPNIWGTVPHVEEMQSEAGASGAYHGAIQAGALGTTFTASQGLLLMIPNMYKIAGELTSTVMHVTARTVATHALSIFGDHSDVMAVRQTGWSMLCSSTVQEVMDMALISQMATLESRVPVLHFFDGFRTSHEEMKVEEISYDDMRALIDDDLVRAHRYNRLSPDSPFIRGSAQNPDVFFQAREACTPFYEAVPDITQKAMDRFAKQVGRKYHLFDYYGAEDAERVIVMMGSGAAVARETVERLMQNGENVGVLVVRLFRPFDVSRFLNALPATVSRIAVLDRCKDPAAICEPLCMDVREALSGSDIMVVGGRYGLSSKDFTPAMVKGVYDELKKALPKDSFTIGIEDDISFSSLDYDPSFDTEDPKTVRCLFYGLGSDGTVGANKNSIKIIGGETDLYAQGYYSYDSKKSGGITVSHLRFGPNPIYASYMINSANFVACHVYSFLEKLDVLKHAAEGGTFLLNSPFGPDEVWDKLPRTTQQRIIDKKLKFYTIDAVKIARETGMGGRTNTIMQTCFFAISGVLEKKRAIKAIKDSIVKSYSRKGQAVVDKNIAAVDATLANLYEVKVPKKATSKFDIKPPVADDAPEFVKDVLGPMMVLQGDSLPVSCLPEDGTFPSGTTQYEKRSIAIDIPSWDPSLCIQCGKCALVCPHAAIRAKVYDADLLKGAPETFKSTDAKWKDFEGAKFTIQVAPEDCVGCGLCAYNCPVKAKEGSTARPLMMVTQMDVREKERDNWNFFLELPDVDRSKLNLGLVKDVQLLRPLFEFSGACAGCGETPYLKLLSALFGDRAIIANATGCSSIYGGNLPTTPWAVNDDGRGPAWSNSLFEDAAEFGLGFRMAIDKHREYAAELLEKMSPVLGKKLVKSILEAPQTTEAEINELRQKVEELKVQLEYMGTEEAEELISVVDNLVRKSVWCVGGDGWAYDIGYGGLDHVIASGKNVNILVLDTEVYSNTGGQMSKSTPRGAVAKFAAGGKRLGKKDLALMAMSYGNVYVGRVALGANDAHTVKVFREAEAYDGPSIIIAYSHCIAHGIDMVKGLEQQKKAVESGHWILMRYNPDLAKEGKNPLVLDSKEPTLPLKDYIYNETRYKSLANADPEVAEALLKEEEKEIKARWRYYSHMAAMKMED